ncbi:MAG: hypothetical protein KA314_13160 [Chloroflexi bacterium]|nr:hypothetical protein [Chloroflexota bacterium]MBP8056787.1 hypothetical protein [Chloroflexota bacterium]
MNLTPEKFAQAETFIRGHGRELEQRLFDFHFKGGTAEAVLTALKVYQNEDGGFGHALEPDFRLPASSPMATSVAFQVMDEVNAAADHPLVQSGIHYLLTTYQKEEGYWPKTFADVNDHPHAPWWHVWTDTPPTEEEWPNPTIELIGVLYRYDTLVPADFLTQVTERAYQNIHHLAHIEDRYNVLCWLRALAALPLLLRTPAEAKIRQTYTNWYPFSPDKLHELNLLMFAPTPDSLLGEMYGEELRPQLDTLIQSQSGDGSWSPAWTWGQYDEVWQVAHKDWQGHITLENLKILAAYNRLHERT